MLAAIAEQRPEDALETSTEAMGLVLEMDPAFVESLSPGSLVSLLGAGGHLDSKRALLLGEVFARRADARVAASDPERAAVERAKAEALLQAVFDLGDPDDGLRAEELLEELSGADGSGGSGVGAPRA